MSERDYMEGDGDGEVFAALARLRERHLLSIDDLLTEKQQAELRADLAKMARQRRRAEAEAAGVWMP